MGVVNNGIINNYTIKPKNLLDFYKQNRRGVTDYTQLGQYNQFETGYSMLAVLAMPEFMVQLGKQDPDNIGQLVDSFKDMLEFEFRGLDGLPDIQADTYDITDGVNSLRLINKVTMDTATTISSTYYEKSGGLITKFSDLYLTGIKDRITQAKTYHGLIKNNILAPGLENEVFTMLYFVTDNTMLRIEKAVLLCNCQLTKAEISMYNSQKGDIDNKEMSIEWNCFPVMGYKVDQAAHQILQDITGVKVTTSSGVTAYKVETEDNIAILDSADYKYGIMNSESPSAIPSLVDAIDNAKA